MDIKSAVKKKLNSGSRIDARDLYKLIQEYDYVSFDIFDTLVKRNVADPIDIFELMELSLGKDFKAKRIEAEKRARVELGKIEVTIEDIYSFFPDKKKEELIKFEMDTEMKSIVPNKPLLEVYKKCIEVGKIVYIVSDIYWSENMIIELLHKNGFKDYRALFLSSTQQRTKNDGSLFKYLLEQQKIKAEQLIHIGDSRIGDYKEPTKLGIKSVKIPRYFKNIEFYGDKDNDRIELNYLNHFINNTFCYTDDQYYQFGYSQFGKLLYGYVNWIHDQAVKLKIKKLFFLARDGFIMKQAYDACVHDKNIETRYLEVSRRSLRVPMLWMDCSYETILKMIVNAKLISIASIFDGLGLEINKYKEVIENCGLDIETVFDRSTIMQDENLRNLISKLRFDIISNSEEEYRIIKKYIVQERIEGKFGIVDIGYAGSMQRYLQQILSAININFDVTGFYLGVAEFYEKNLLDGLKMDMKGYLFDFQHDKNAEDNRSSFVGLFESLFLEGEGTVKRFTIKYGKVQAERYPYEYIKDGKLTEDYLKIKKVQQGALDFVKEAAMDHILYFFRFTSDKLFYGLFKTGTSPKKKDIELFADIEFYDEGVTEKLANPNKITYYIVHPKKLKYDFLRCRWKIGFMKRFLKLPLPYQKIYRVLQEIQ